MLELNIWFWMLIGFIAITSIGITFFEKRHIALIANKDDTIGEMLRYIAQQNREVSESKNYIYQLEQENIGLKVELGTRYKHDG